MSYQLIYTSAEELLDPGLTGYGVVACSVGTPPLLRSRLISLSDVSGADETGETPVWFAYRICTCGGDVFHVLSRYCWAGADYSGRKRILAHHLALTADEVSALKRNAARPTPAGIMFALQKKHFWAENWEGPPRELEGEPRLLASSLPDASGQAAWKAYTGHKNNARAFFTPPYEGACLVEVPSDMEASDILLLLNESDWLSTSRGWGKTFSTHAEEGSDVRETERLIRPSSSSGCPPKGNGATLPLLRIGQQMNLPHPPEPSTDARPPLREQDNSPLSTPQLPPVASPSSSCYLPYKYCERPDEETYQVTPRRRLSAPIFAALAGVLLLAGASLFLFAGHGEPSVPHSAKPVSAAHPSDDALNLLQKLLAAPYSAAATTRQLDRIQARMKVQPPLSEEESALQDELRECVSLLQHASSDPGDHAGNLLRLRECAKALSLNTRALCELYLREMLHDRSLEEWQTSLNEEEYRGWCRLLEESPDMGRWFLQGPFLPYMASIVTRASLHLPERSVSALPPAPVEDTESAPPAESAPPVVLRDEPPVMAGSPLPPCAQEILTSAPLSLSVGECELFVFPPDKGQPRHYNLHLKEGESTVNILPDGGKGYILRADTSSSFPAVSIRVKDGVLQSVSSEGHPACLRLSLTRASDAVKLTLLSPWQMTLHPMGEGAPPSTDRVDFSLSPDRLELCSSPDSSREGVPPVLRLKPGKAFPWTPMLSELQLRPSPTLLYLPVLTGTNLPLPVQEEADQLPYSWRAEKEPARSTPTADAYTCHMQRVYDFARPLMECFHKVANTACCGQEPEGDPFFSLASVHALVSSLGDAQLTPERRDFLYREYIRLFSHPLFAQQLSDLFREEPQLFLTPQQTTDVGKAAKTQRRRVQEALALPEKRQFLLRRVREALSAALAKAYEQERQMPPPLGTGDMKLLLQRLDRTPQGEFLWFFSLQPMVRP